MFTRNPIWTNAGKAAFASAASERKSLIFTRFALGSGTPSGDAENQTALENEELSVSINSMKNDAANRIVKISGAFESGDVQDAFYAKELGLFAKVGDTGSEILAAYLFEENGEYIDPTGGVAFERVVAVNVSVSSSTAEIDATIAGNLYALQSDVTNLQNIIDTTIAGNLYALQSDVTNLQNIIDTTIAGNLYALQSDVTNLQNILDSLTAFTLIADSSNASNYPFSNFATNLDNLGVHPATPTYYKIIKKGNRIHGIVQYIAGGEGNLKFSDVLGARATPKGKMRIFSVVTRYRPSSDFASLEQPFAGSTRINDTYTFNSNFEEYPCVGYISQSGLCIAYSDHTESLYDLTIRFSYDLG